MGTCKTLKTCFLLWVFAAGLSTASSSFQDEKNFYFYYTPYPSAGSPPPIVSYQNPPPAHANDPPVVSYQNPPPAHANDPPVGSNPPSPHADSPPAVSYQNPPPVQPQNPPSGGSTMPVDHTPPHRHGHHHHHHGHKPPTNCEIPPAPRSVYGSPTPPPPTGYHNNPPSSGGGGSINPPSDPPAAPAEQPVVQPPSPTVVYNPSPPSGGCSCGGPPMSPGGPVVAPIPTSPSRPGYHYYPPPYTTTPPSTTPSIIPPSGSPATTPTNPPSTDPPTDDPPSVDPPITPPSHPKPASPRSKTQPGTGNTFPSPPSFPNIPFIGGTCDFWRRHPHLLSDLFGWWRTTVGRAMGLGGIPGIGASMSFQEALTNTRTDGIGALYREGTASLLNSIVNKNFPFTTSHVVDSFVAALASNKAAAAQAQLFKLANEGQLKPRV